MTSFSIGLGLLTGATLVIQTALTRLFSVIFFYHLSLVAVAASMFGLALGALLVRAFPGLFSNPQSRQRAGEFSALTGLSALGGLMGCLFLRLDLSLNTTGILSFLAWIGFVATPFVFSGVAVCLCLTRFPQIVGRLYAWDLAGAALGCLITTSLMSLFGPINTIVFSALMACVGGVLMAEGRRRLLTALACVPALTLVLNSQLDFLKIHYIQGEPNRPSKKYELWNAFSHVLVTQPSAAPPLSGPGARFQPERWNIEHMMLFMDTRANTSILKFNGDFDQVGWLRYDVIALVHELRSTGPTLVIGPGGGKDLLAALRPARGQREVVGVDINPMTRKIVLDWEKDYNHLAHFPQLRYVNDEARSWLEREARSFQVISIPMVDTWAATTAGAFALSENSLYTLEAFRLYLRHLSDDGILSVSRWWHSGRLGETHRLLLLAARALAAEGIHDPRRHMLVALGGETSNLLLSRKPFTPDDEARFLAICEEVGFQPLLSPSLCRDQRFLTLFEHPELATGQMDGIYLDLSPPSDDRPYFFHSYSLRNLWHRASGARVGVTPSERDAMVVLSILVSCSSALALTFWLWPVIRRQAQPEPLSYFGLIGLAFMFIESALMQRLNLFLGYPIYSLVVTLFTLLLASAAGSLWVQRALDQGRFRPLKFALFLLLALFVVDACCLWLLPPLASQEIVVRILVSGLLMVVCGLPMGMMYPLGVRRVGPAGLDLSWAWALNGATSAAAAVISIATSLSYGIHFTFMAGMLCYAAALLILYRR